MGQRVDKAKIGYNPIPIPELVKENLVQFIRARDEFDSMLETAIDSITKKYEKMSLVSLLLCLADVMEENIAPLMVGALSARADNEYSQDDFNDMALAIREQFSSLKQEIMEKLSDGKLIFTQIDSTEYRPQGQ